MGRQGSSSIRSSYIFTRIMVQSVMLGLVLAYTVLSSLTLHTDAFTPLYGDDYDYYPSTTVLPWADHDYDYHKQQYYRYAYDATLAPEDDDYTAEEIPAEPVCIDKTKVHGSNIRLTLTDGSNFATVNDKEECLDLCDQYKECLSIEYNDGFKKCQINSRILGDDVQGKHERWQYCPKRG